MYKYIIFIFLLLAIVSFARADHLGGGRPFGVAPTNNFFNKTQENNALLRAAMTQDTNLKTNTTSYSFIIWLVGILLILILIFFIYLRYKK